MDAQEFENFLRERHQPEERISQHVQIMREFQEYLTATQTPAIHAPRSDEAQNFISFLKAAGRDTYDNVAALARYGLFTENRSLYLTALQFVDGGEVLDNLYDRLARSAGTHMRDQIFRGVQLPTIGSPLAERPVVMRTVIRRMEELLDEETFTSILSGCLRTLPPEWYQEDKEKYRLAKNLDEYLDQRSLAYLAELEQIKDKGRLYFNQEITDEVIDFVRSQPEMARGVRRGNILYMAKIPYMAKEYLAENDERMKRYYYCHCPWVRASLKDGGATVSPRFCLCSSGYEKKAWEVIFDEPLVAEVVESVLRGDLRCTFAIHLPEGV